jgi:hypothetical protein
MPTTETCPTCFGDGTVTNGSAGPDTAPGSVTWCPTCFGRRTVSATSNPPTEVIHIAGYDVQVDALLRQRCAWCGGLLIDYDLSRMAVPVGTDPRPATWPVGDLVAVDGTASWTVPHTDGDPLPAGTCTRIDPEVTR